MSNKTLYKKNITYSQIKSWGMFYKVSFESYKDEVIKDFADPNSDQEKEIIKIWLNENKISTEKLFNMWLKLNRMCEKDWKIYIFRNWKWTKWCLDYSKDKISDYYLQRKDSLDLVKYSLLRVKSKDLATELYLRIKEKESSFYEIATQFSEGPERNCGGLIGPVEISKANPSLAKLLRVSSITKLLAPVKIQETWIILRVEERINTPLDEKLSLRLSLELGSKYIENNLDKVNSLVKSNDNN